MNEAINLIKERIAQVEAETMISDFGRGMLAGEIIGLNSALAILGRMSA